MSVVKLGYNTNGLAFHRWPDLLELVAEVGYRSVAITVDHHCLNPFAPDHERQMDEAAARLDAAGLGCVVETGARFLLDPRHKHAPTLLDPDPRRRGVRLDFLKRCVSMARHLNADAVSFWSGIRPETVPDEEAWGHLVSGCAELASFAEEQNVRLAFEPEPGMLIESMQQFDELSRRVASPVFGLTLDVGHVQCVEATPIPEVIRAWSDRLWNVHIEDMCRGVHEHLRFGEGEIDFPPVLQSLREIGYTGGLHVELSRHSHMAPTVLRESYDFLIRSGATTG